MFAVILALLPAEPPSARPIPAAVVEHWLCESCRLRPAVRVVVVNGESFQVCQGCDTGARS